MTCGCGRYINPNRLKGQKARCSACQSAGRSVRGQHAGLARVCRCGKPVRGPRSAYCLTCFWDVKREIGRKSEMVRYKDGKIREKQEPHNPREEDLPAHIIEKMLARGDAEIRHKRATGPKETA